MTPVSWPRRDPDGGRGAITINPGPVDVQAIRRHFTFPQLGRIVTNNAASTQPPRELLALYQSLAPQYENVHRGQSLRGDPVRWLTEPPGVLSMGMVLR